MFNKAKQHLKEANESYAQHMLFALSFAAGCLLAFFYSLIHALFPGLYKTAASEKVKELYSQLEGRTQDD